METALRIATFALLGLLFLGQRKTMANSEENAQKLAELGEDIDTIKTGVAELRTQISDLKDQIEVGDEWTEENQEALDALATKADELADTFETPAPEDGGSVNPDVQP